MQFEKYVKLLQKKSWDYAKKYGIEYEEMLAQAYLIYCECLEKYIPGKASFTTYLYIQLNRLGDFARTYNRQKGLLLQDHFQPISNEDENLEVEVESPMPLMSKEQFLSIAGEKLSSIACCVLAWIVNYEWVGTRRRVPTVEIASRSFGIDKERMNAIWNEIGTYWRNEGYTL